MIRILTDEPYRVNLEYDDLKFSLRDELGEEIDMNVEELLWTAPPKNLSNSRKNTIRFLDPPAVDERDVTRLGEICKERFGDEWDIVSIKSPGHVLRLVEEAKRLGLDLGSSNSTPIASSMGKSPSGWVKVFRHDTSSYQYGAGLFDSANDFAEAKRSNPYNPNSNKYSILDEVETLGRDSDGTYVVLHS